MYIYIKLDLQGFTTSNVWFSNRLPTGMHPQVSAENPLLAQIHPRSLSLSKKRRAMLIPLCSERVKVTASNHHCQLSATRKFLF